MAMQAPVRIWDAMKSSPPVVTVGMGEAYRARDAKLGRDVAMMVLPDTLRA
jgi:hypothetical protein